MRFIFRWIFRLVVLLIVLGVAAVLLKDAILKSYTENRLRRETGLEVRIGRMEMGLFTPTLTFENLKVFNPSEFGGLPFLDIPELHVEYDRVAFAVNKLHFRLVRLNLEEMNIVKAVNGRSNLELLSAWQPGSPNQPQTKYRFTGIDMLNLTVNRVQFVQLADTTKNQEIKVDLHNAIVKDIKSYEDFAQKILGLFIRSGLKSLNSFGWPSPSAN